MSTKINKWEQCHWINGNMSHTMKMFNFEQTFSNSLEVLHFDAHGVMTHLSILKTI